MDRNTISKNSTRTALGGILASLSVVLMMLTSVIPTLTYALPAMSGVLLVIEVIEVDKKWAAGVYATVSVLSVFLLADKEAATMYVMFFGYYPILKAVIESKCPRWLSWLLKFFLFNLSMTAAFLLVTYVFHIPFEEMEKYGAIAAWGLLGLGNVAFLLYDFALSRLIGLYLLKWRKAFRRIFKL